MGTGLNRDHDQDRAPRYFQRNSDFAIQPHPHTEWWETKRRLKASCLRIICGPYCLPENDTLSNIQHALQHRIPRKNARFERIAVRLAPEQIASVDPGSVSSPRRQNDPRMLESPRTWLHTSHCFGVHSSAVPRRRSAEAAHFPFPVEQQSNTALWLDSCGNDFRLSRVIYDGSWRRKIWLGLAERRVKR